MEDKILSLENAYAEDGIVWFSSMYFNSLFCYDIKNDKLSWKGFFPNEKKNGKWLYSRAVKVGNKLYFPPYNANEMAVYEPESEHFEKINLGIPQDRTEKIYSVATYENKVFMFGAKLDEYIIYDCESGVIEHCSVLYEDLKQYCLLEAGYYISRQCAIIGNHCYLSSRRAPVLIDFDMENNTYQISGVETDAKGFASVTEFEGDLIAVPWDAEPIIRWNPKTKKSKQYIVPYSASEGNFSYTAINEKSFYLFAMRGLASVQISNNPDGYDVCNLSIEYCDKSVTDATRLAFPMQKISWTYCFGERIYYFSNMDRYLYKIVGENSVRMRQFEIPAELYQIISLCRKIEKEKLISMEENENDLTNFISAIEYK